MKFIDIQPPNPLYTHWENCLQSKDRKAGFTWANTTNILYALLINKHVPVLRNCFNLNNIFGAL